MERFRKTLLLAVKIGIGSSIAIFLAQTLHLQYAASAGTVTLLTLMTSKWETIRLSIARFATFAVTILVSWLVFTHIDSMWVCYGLALTVVVFLAESLGWRTTISVNSVVAAHLLTDENFNAAAIWNELQLVLIGVVLALILNLFNGNASHRKKIIADMRGTETRLQAVLRNLAAYLSGESMSDGVWDELCTLREDIDGYTKSAYEYQNNTFQSHPEYYIAYFEMRQEQCSILRNLHNEMARLRYLPTQANIISEYLYYLSDYVIERNVPEQQTERLNAILEDMKSQELPKSREEFENRAMLYHVLMDIQDFLGHKARFVSSLDPAQLARYWKTSSQKEPAVR